MKIVNIIGGLGNQMFQYAFLVALRESCGVETCYDASLFKTYPLHNGFELEKLFRITARQAPLEEIRKLTYHTSNYFIWRILKRFPHRSTQCFEPSDSRFTYSLLEDPNDLYYYGIWQDPRYFNQFKGIIRQEFSWKDPLDEKNKSFYNQFRAHHTVSIHVRRGDYLKEWRYEGICGIEYYKKAIGHVLSSDGVTEVSFALFSDDIPWCIEHIIPLLQGRPYTIVDWNSGAESHKDMRLMSACRTNIIANSSFSWWAAYLNTHPDSMVFAPRKWTNADVLSKRQLDDWVLID